MSLIDDLRSVQDSIPPSHSPTPAEVPGVLGALITYLEVGGDKLLEAAAAGGQDLVAQLFPQPAPPAETGEPAAPAPSPPPPAAATPSPSEELAAARAEAEQLRAQLAAAQGAANRTTVEVLPSENQQEVHV